MAIVETVKGGHVRATLSQAVRFRRKVEEGRRIMEQQRYYESNLVKAGGALSCVDDRLEVDGTRRKSPQLLGGGLEIHDLMLIACHEAGLDVNRLMAEGEEVDLLELTDKVVRSKVGRQYGIEMGVHNDDDHGRITDEEELAGRDEGCGYDKVRSGVLRDEWGVGLRERRGLVSEARKRGAACETYTGGHVKGAVPVENYRVGTTVDSEAVFKAERAAFGHDIWLVKELLPVMAEELAELGGKFERAAGLLEAEGMDWSRALYRGTLAKLGNPNGGKVIEVGK